MLLAAIPAAGASTYFGAAVSGEVYGQTGNAPRNMQAWDLFERHAGRKVAILLQGQDWTAFDSYEMDATSARGAIPLVTMGLKGTSLESVAKGGQDAAIKKWAQEAKAWGHPFLFAPWWEMNGAWYAWGRNSYFVAAWRRFHDLVVGQGATNVTWTWVSNSLWSDPASDPTPYYPGDAYVDWVGIDAYNVGYWMTWDDMLKEPTLPSIYGTFEGRKPIMISETASQEASSGSYVPAGATKASWIADTHSKIVKSYPAISAFLWFHQKWGSHDFRADSSPSAFAAFKNMASDPRFNPSGGFIPATP
ncbi:MAG TPA: glycosyl hydrolase, partial [Solirubrobacterales bacterium]|nr:glycosyl hydrolase [Solirubrobacterales bacterium]